MPLDVAAQREQEGLEPRPDPQRTFLTYRLTLDFFEAGRGGREKKKGQKCYYYITTGRAHVPRSLSAETPDDTCICWTQRKVLTQRLQI